MDLFDKFFPVVLESLEESRVMVCKHRDGKKPRIHSSRLSDGECRYGNPFGHLYNGVERVDSSQMRRGNRYAQDGEWRQGGEHPGKMGRPSRPGNDDPKTAFPGGLCVVDHVQRSAVGGNHPAFVRKREPVEDL